MEEGHSTEDKIKNSARALFFMKGYSATKTRDIAKAANINVALLNYYFRSKEKLFQEIMMESLYSFFQGIKAIYNDSDTSLDDKIEKITTKYIDHITQNPDMPMFILSELRNRPDEFINEMSGHIKLKESVIYQQLDQKIGKQNLSKVNPIHYMINLMSLIVFPFVGRPMLQRTGEVDNTSFHELMEERKQFIPMWIMQMLK